MSVKEKITKRENQPTLSVIDSQRAEMEIVKQIQKEAFGQEVKDLSVSNHTQYNSRNNGSRHLKCTLPLYRLDPFIDENGLLRVGGHLDRGNFSKKLKHLIILPRKSHITKCVISHFHQSIKHEGHRMMINEI